jgi:hypothetical protein
MALFLDKIDSVPALYSDFDEQFLQWLWVLVDSLNENINDIQNAIMSTSLVTAVTQLVEINSRYIPTNVALTAFQLPVNALEGVRVTIAGQGAGGWILLTGLGQTIQVADVGATATTSVASSSRYDSIEIICVLANTTWITLSTQTSGFIIV